MKGSGQKADRNNTAFSRNTVGSRQRFQTQFTAGFPSSFPLHDAVAVIPPLVVPERKLKAHDKVVAVHGAAELLANQRGNVPPVVLQLDLSQTLIIEPDQSAQRHHAAVRDRVALQTQNADPRAAAHPLVIRAQLIHQHLHTVRVNVAVANLQNVQAAATSDGGTNHLAQSAPHFAPKLAQHVDIVHVEEVKVAAIAIGSA